MLKAQTDTAVTRRRAAGACVLAVAVVAAGLTAGADVIYDNGSFSIYDSYDSDIDLSVQQADDFVLNDGANILTDIHWWGHLTDGYPDDPTSLFTLTIFTEDSGAPGDAIWQQTAEVAWQDTGLDMDPETFSIWDEESQQYLNLRDIYAYDFVLPTALVLNPGQTYYLSVLADTTSDIPEDWAWCVSDPGGHASRGAGFDWATDWYGNPSDLAFYLTYEPTDKDENGVVPEPASLLLLSAGLGGLLLRRRLRQESSQ